MYKWFKRIHPWPLPVWPLQVSLGTTEGWGKGGDRTRPFLRSNQQRERRARSPKYSWSHQTLSGNGVKGAPAYVNEQDRSYGNWSLSVLPLILMWFLFLKYGFSGNLNGKPEVFTFNSKFCLSKDLSSCWNLFTTLSGFQLLPLPGLLGFSSHTQRGVQESAHHVSLFSTLGFLLSTSTSFSSSRVHSLILLPNKTTALYKSPILFSSAYICITQTV